LPDAADHPITPVGDSYAHTHPHLIPTPSSMPFQLYILDLRDTTVCPILRPNYSEQTACWTTLPLPSPPAAACQHLPTPCPPALPCQTTTYHPRCAPHTFVPYVPACLCRLPYTYLVPYVTYLLYPTLYLPTHTFVVIRTCTHPTCPHTAPHSYTHTFPTLPTHAMPDVRLTTQPHGITRVFAVDAGHRLLCSAYPCVPRTCAFDAFSPTTYTPFSCLASSSLYLATYRRLCGFWFGWRTAAF